MMDPAPERVDVDTRLQRLVIEWSDGHAQVFPFDALREACPCAECQGGSVDRIEKPGFLDLFRRKDRQENVEVEQAGSIGLRITWDDGHNAGIFRWPRLRDLQPPD